jgi:hypothetical protein
MTKSKIRWNAETPVTMELIEDYFSDFHQFDTVNSIPQLGSQLLQS